MKMDTPMEEKVAPEEIIMDSNVAVVTIEGNDQMKYNKSEIRVKAGQTVKLTLKHVGKMKKMVMGHNWVLLTQDADMATVGQAGAMAADNDYIPADMTDMIITHTKMLGGGESDTIEFEAPAPGTYTFMCTFPAHYALMQGTFIVE
ncbi:azurin [Bizionia saleffrena]|nr:azurin [Bizionia saleffrena]